MDTRETGRPSATDGAFDDYLKSLPSPSSKEFFEERERRRTHLRERKWRRFSRRAASVVAVSAGGALGIVGYGAVAGVPQRDIVRGALSVICVGPMFGIVVAVMVLIQVATFELRMHTVRHVLGSDRAESLLPERPWTFLRWLVLGGPVVYGMGVSGITRRVERDGGPQAVTESRATV